MVVWAEHPADFRGALWYPREPLRERLPRDDTTQRHILHALEKPNPVASSHDALRDALQVAVG